jgi:hypothetical protein
MYGPFGYPTIIGVTGTFCQYAVSVAVAVDWEKSIVFPMTWLYKSSTLELVGMTYIEIYRYVNFTGKELRSQLMMILKTHHV